MQIKRKCRGNDRSWCPISRTVLAVAAALELEAGACLAAVVEVGVLEVPAQVRAKAVLSRQRVGFLPLDLLVCALSACDIIECDCCYCLGSKSCPTLCDPMNCSPPGSSVHGILQARILEWVAISFSRGSSQPRDWTHVSCTGRQISLLLNHQGNPLNMIY